MTDADLHLKAWALVAVGVVFGLAIIAVTVVGGIAFSKVEKGAGSHLDCYFNVAIFYA